MARGGRGRGRRPRDAPPGAAVPAAAQARGDPPGRRPGAAPPGTAPAGSGQTWDDAQNALAGRARRRVAEGAAHEEWAVAYHQLAAGDLGAAAAYLNRRFDEVGAGAWCTELCRLRRARCGRRAARWTTRRATTTRRWCAASCTRRSPVRRPDERMKAIIRLLAASWISPEPCDDEATDRIGDPYRNPLGDPYAELYADIGAEFLTLRDLVDDERDRHVFLQKSAQYKRRPWW
ncbi:hypothetical protein NKH77_37775 [Streptomyces sp. M19]